MNELADAFFLHSMFTDAHNLLCNDSDGDSSDDEVVSSKIAAVVLCATSKLDSL
jgi:hypothetical protein